MKKGVKRFVLVTSIGTGDSKGAPPQQVYDVLEKVLVQKGKAEEFLQVPLFLFLPPPLKAGMCTHTSTSASPNHIHALAY